MTVTTQRGDYRLLRELLQLFGWFMLLDFSEAISLGFELFIYESALGRASAKLFPNLKCDVGVDVVAATLEDYVRLALLVVVANLINV